jgi:hypothetical protein
MSRVFQNIDPHPPLRPASVSSPHPPTKAGGTHSPGGEGGVGSIFWKTRDIGLASFSNNLSARARIYRPSIRENKPKTLGFSH